MHVRALRLRQSADARMANGGRVPGGHVLLRGAVLGVVVLVLATVGGAHPLAQVAVAAPNGLVAAYGFEAGSGTAVADSSGNGNNGTISNATWTTAGKFGKALSFNGTNARVNVPDSASLHLTTGMTLEAWVRPSASASKWRDAIYKGADNYYLEASSQPGGRPAVGGTFGGVNATLNGTSGLANNTWTFVTATYDGATLRLYVNGAQVATQARAGAIATSANQLQIGGDSIYGQYFQGSIDEVRIYNVALTATQIGTDMTTAVDTGAPPDTQVPGPPGTLTATSTSSSQINLSWGAASDNVGVTGYLIERCKDAGCSSFAQIGTSSTTTFNNIGLIPNTSYTYRVRATDAAGNLGAYSNVATTTTLPDTQPPGAPGALTATTLGSTQINLSWGAATDNVGVTGYLVERCEGVSCSTFTQIGPSSTTTFNDTGLTSGTVYGYRVRATDAAGNLGSYSNVATATTTQPDNQPPGAPGTLTAIAAGSGQINLSWGAANDNVGVVNYLVERCQGASCSDFAQIGTSTTTTFNNTGLTAGTTYSYRVRATDAAANLGAYSNVASATTTQAATAGLVAAYAFNEGSGTTVTDTSGNGNTGTLANATWTVGGKYGGALSFNGSNATVNIPDSATLHLGSAMTLEAWVNPTTVSSIWRDVIYKANDVYYLEGTSDRLGVPAGGGTFGGTGATAYGSAAVTASVWTHLAVTYDGATLRVYVNGVQVGSQARAGSIANSTNPLQIGGDSIHGQYFQGSIDEVRIYNTTLAASDIASDMSTPVPSGGGGGGGTDNEPPSTPGALTATTVNSSRIDLNWGAATDNVAVTGYRVDRCLGAGCTNFSHIAQIQPPVTNYSDTGLAPGTSYTYQVRAMDGAGNLSDPTSPATAVTQAGTISGLVASYAFDEGTGTTVNDSSGHGNAGTVSGTTWTSSGIFGGALVFNGTTSLVTVPDSSSLRLTNGMTLEAWVNPSSATPSWRDVIYKGNDNYYLEASSDQGLPTGGGTFGGASRNVFGGGALPTGSWTHLAFTYDGSTLRLYANGVQVGSQAATSPITVSSNPLQIGGDSLYGQKFAGKIDEVRVYDGALTASQIQADMNSALAIPSTPANLTATVASSARIDLGWGASSDSAGVTGYRVERCQGTGCSSFAEIAAPGGTSYSDTGVSANTSYSYRVRAIDAAGKFGGYSNVATAYTGLLLSPRNVAITPAQAQQYTATSPGGGSPTVTWSVDGVDGGNSTVGTITSGGLYTAPPSAGTHTVTATSQTQSGSATAYTTNYGGVFTYHGDNMRTGQNLAETVLTPTNVNSPSFGKLFSLPLDGAALAQPLYVENLGIPGQGTHNVVFVATEHDSVYAYDADGRSSTPLWKVSFINPSAGITTVPAGDTGECCDIQPEIGITSTPVVDRSTNTIYVVAKTKEGSGGNPTYVQRLHALDITTGAEKFGGPIVIQASVPGTGAGSSGGRVPFNSLRENQRTALLLQNGKLYFGFASHGDVQPYHGWILGYDATTLQQTLAFCLTPNQEGAGVWMSGSGIASDSTGSLYYISGDGEFDGSGEWGDSYIRMTTTGTVTDYFTPFNQDALNSGNHDLGSGGALLLPDQGGAHPHEMLSAGKDGTVYLVDRDNMGHYSTTANNIVQTLPNIFPNGTPEPGNFTAPVYLAGYVFFGPLADNLQAFKLTNGLLSTSATFRSASVFPDRGASMAGSANGSTNSILWAVQRNGAGAGVLYAYDPAGSSNGVLAELYDSGQAGSRDTLDAAAKFNPPVIANGHVYVAGLSQLTVFGLLP
jgi:chitodextrinase